MISSTSRKCLATLLVLFFSSTNASLNLPSNQKNHDDLLRQLQTETGWNAIGQQLNGQAAGDQSGWAVAMNDDGSRVAVAAPNNDAGGTDAGDIRVYEFNTNNQWALLGSAIQGSAGAAAGQAIALSGDGLTVAYGSFREFPYKGYVKLFRWEANAWRELTQLNGVSDRDRFGGSVSLSGDGTRIAVGAAYHDGSTTIRGHTMVFEQDLGDDTVWNNIGEIDGVNEGDRSGHAVAISSDGSTVAIGEIASDPANLQNAGTVTVWERTSSIQGWTQRGLDIAGVAAGDQSGYSVDISEDGMVVAIGSPMHAAQAAQGGMARVFMWDTTTLAWVQLGTNLLPETPAVAGKFGQSVSLSLDGLILAVGEPNDAGVGKTSIYQYNSNLNAWSRDITLSDGAATDRFGYSVALSGQGTRVAIGAYNEDAAGVDSGRTRVYEFQTSDWILTVDDFTANFASGTTPEFSIVYQGITPAAGTGRTYRTTMLLASCGLGAATDTSIAPVTATGPVPDTENFRLVSQLDVNTDTVRNSGYYSDKGLGKGEIAFCVQMEILEGTVQKAERFADINVQLDMGQDFLVTDFISRDPTTGKTDIREDTEFNYAFTPFFCDDFGQEITGGGQSVPPGGEVSVCLRADTGEPVVVSDVKSVSFENFLAPLLGVELIDDLGNTLDGTTVKDCSNGLCRVAAITVPRLYEYVDNEGNVVDVTAGVSMEGTVVFEFPTTRRGLQQSAEPLEQSFSIKIDLASPPDRSNNKQQSSAIASMHRVTLTMGSVVTSMYLFL